MDLKEMRLLGERISGHWYYRAKLAALLKAIDNLPPCTVLDVGAGSGFFSRALLESGRATKAICVDPGYVADSDELVAGHVLLLRRAFSAQYADVGLVLMMDVLEHVADDLEVAREYFERIPSGARVIVTVPAFSWLWSNHDVFLGHYRRYTLPELEKVLQAAGLQIEFGSYYYGAVMPIAAGVRLGRRLLCDLGQEPRSDMRRFEPLLNALLWSACWLELPFFRMNRIGGLTVFVRGVKPD